MSSKVTYTFYDVRGKATSMHLNAESVTGATYDGLEAQAALLRTDLESLLLSGQHSMLISQPNDNGTPQDRDGVRGAKALIKWFSASEGDGGQYGSNEIGCADVTNFTAVGDKLILQGALYDLIKTHFDAFVKTENGNDVAVYEVEYVTRNI